MSRRLSRVAGIGLVCLTAACASSSGPLYRWGVYEGLVYDMYMRPGKADPTTQISKLQADLERTDADGQHAPPGVHAHLGFLYYGEGQTDAAYQHFVIEKTLFPESAVFIDGILARMAKMP